MTLLQELAPVLAIPTGVAHLVETVKLQMVTVNAVQIVITLETAALIMAVLNVTIYIYIYYVIARLI